MHKREIGEKTGNGWENGKPVEGVFVCWPSVLLQGACPPWQGACPPHPPSQGAIHTPTLTELSHTLACRHPCIPQRNCRTPQRNYATRWPAGVAFLLRAYCIPNECVLCAYGKSVCKREIGEKTGNEAGGKPPAPPIQQGASPPHPPSNLGVGTRGSELGGRN